jgi:hypothetical protein
MTMFNATSKEEYDAAWLDVITMTNEKLYRIPMYANTWFDFIHYDSGLKNYFGNSYWGFRHAVQRAWIAR